MAHSDRIRRMSIESIARPQSGTHAPLTDAELNDLVLQLQHALNEAAHGWLNRDGIIRDTDGLAGTCVSAVGKRVIDRILYVSKRNYENGDRLQGFEFGDVAPRDVAALRQALSSENIRKAFDAAILEYNTAATMYNESLTSVVSPYSLALEYNDRFDNTSKAIAKMSETAIRFLTERSRGEGTAATR